MGDDFGRPDLSNRQITLATLLLAGIYTLSFVDRQILAILAEPIRKELKLSDSQIGLMTGLAFALLYTIGGIPLARYADRKSTNRITLITVCLALWSIVTALCGSAQSFAQLALLRVGVGIGEAGCTPAAHSLISDLVPPSRRASAMSKYGLGQPIGSLLGLVAGGMIADAFGWRAAFWIVGLPGVLFALVAKLLLPEPRRMGTTHASSVTITAESLRQALAAIFRSRTYTLMLVAGGLITFLGYGTTVWNTIYLQRHFGLSTAQTGISLGLVIGIAGITGTLLGGPVAEWFGNRDPGRQLTPIIWGFAISAPLQLIGYNAADWRVTVGTMIAPAICIGLSYGPSWALAQTLVPAHTRATASAVKLFVQSLFGIGFGPLLFGMASDALKHQVGADSVRWVLCGAALLLLAPAFIYWLASRGLKAEIDANERIV